MQHVWKKRWRVISIVAVAFVALVLLIAAVSSTNNKVCKGINIEIFGPSNNFFVDAKQVKEIINSGEDVEGQKLEDINLKVLEDRLRKDKWIQDADLFFDKDEVLQVRVEEKEPVARIFTTTGSSFYIDSSCQRLPLSNTLSARVPMFTNFPSDRQRLSKPDSALMASIKELSVYILADDFWKAQVAQVDITESGFEMIPTIGDHVVVLGKGDDYQEKFDRLFTFYKQVWTKVGLAAYEKIDVQYKGQVVVTKKGASLNKVDTVKAREAMATLMAKMKATSDDVTTAHIAPVKKEERTETTISAATNVENKKVEAKESEVKRNEVKPKVVLKSEDKKVPKAVMGKRE